MTALQHVLFLLSVAAATYTQNLTGFAFGLVLLGLVALLHVAPLPVTANVVMMMVLVNATIVVRRRPDLPARVLATILASSLVGVACGVTLLTWLSDNAVYAMRLALGIAILSCSLLLLIQSRARPTLSPQWTFVTFGWLSGVMGGVFASAGPPMVFHMYRQPLKPNVIRETLVLLFAVNAVLRLAMVAGQGRFDHASAMLSLEALPVMVGLTWLNRVRPPGWSPQVVRRVVFGLLLLAGISLVLPALPRLVPHGGEQTAAAAVHACLPVQPSGAFA
jgi:hypothetical protein